MTTGRTTILISTLLFTNNVCGQQITRIPNVDSDGSVAVRVSGASLVQTAQLFPKLPQEADLSQCKSVLSKLDEVLDNFDSDSNDIVKLNLYVRDSAVRLMFLQTYNMWAASKHPAIAVIATPLPRNAAVALDAIFVARRRVSGTLPELRRMSDSADSREEFAISAAMPTGDIVYISGQAQNGDLAEATRATLDSLHKTLRFADLDLQHVVQVKCFLKPMADVAVVQRQISRLFANRVAPPVSHVEWTSQSRPIEIEMVAWAPHSKSKATVEFFTPAGMKSSPVFSRMARVYGDDRIYISGLYGKTKGTGEEQVRSIFGQLKAALNATGSDMNHMAKATYYVSNADSSSQLNKLRPEYYDPKRPPAASKAMMAGLGAPDRSISMDIIAAPVHDDRPD